MDIIKMLKPNQIIWEQYKFNGKVEYVVITKNRFRDIYCLCQVQDNKLKEIAKNESPLRLFEIMQQHRKQRGCENN